MLETLVSTLLVHWQGLSTKCRTITKEYVASLIGLIKNNGALSCAGKSHRTLTVWDFTQTLS